MRIPAAAAGEETGAAECTGMGAATDRQNTQGDASRRGRLTEARRRGSLARQQRRWLAPQVEAPARRAARRSDCGPGEKPFSGQRQPGCPRGPGDGTMLRPRCILLTLGLLAQAFAGASAGAKISKYLEGMPGCPIGPAGQLLSLPEMMSSNPVVR